MDTIPHNTSLHFDWDMVLYPILKNYLKKKKKNDHLHINAYSHLIIHEQTSKCQNPFQQSHK